MYCVIITTAYPDYKRPYASVDVKHFKSEEEAKTYVKNSKVEYYKDYGVLEQYLDRFDDDEDPSKIDFYDEKVLNEIDDFAFDYIYADSYMDMLPFSSDIRKIEI